MADLLTLDGLDARYGDFQALYGLSARVAPGEVVAMIGANGAGKARLMRSVAGLIRNRPEMILWKGQPIGALRADGLAALGIARVPEGRHHPATAHSRGQQQMVAIRRALMANPDFILMDEISLGLAPVVIRQIYDAPPRLVVQGMAAVIVEQDITRALPVTSRAYCLQEGRISLEGASQQLSRAYFGM